MNLEAARAVVRRLLQAKGGGFADGPTDSEVWRAAKEEAERLDLWDGDYERFCALVRGLVDFYYAPREPVRERHPTGPDQG